MDYSDVVPSHSLFDIEDRTAPNTVKFGLYVKTHAMKQLEESLKQILLLPKAERETWVLDHEEWVNSVLDNFVQDSTLALNGLQLDQEATDLSIEYVTKLRDVMNTIRGILDEAKSLNS